MINAEEARNITNKYDSIKQEIEDIDAIIKYAASQGNYKASVSKFSEKTREYLITNGYKVFGYWILDYPIISWKAKKQK